MSCKSYQQQSTLFLTDSIPGHRDDFYNFCVENKMEFSGDRVIGTPLKKGREVIKCLTFVGERFVISIQTYPEEGKTRIGHSFKTEGLYKMNPRGKLI